MLRGLALQTEPELTGIKVEINDLCEFVPPTFAKAEPELCGHSGNARDLHEDRTRFTRRERLWANFKDRPWKTVSLPRVRQRLVEAALAVDSLIPISKNGRVSAILSVR
jgi:hypothetical protein